MDKPHPSISVVIPVYKCAECLEELHRRLVRILEPLVSQFEIIFVNDASPDDAWKIIGRLACCDANVKGINLSRNFGQHRAITAGVDHAEGDWVVVMDGDLQHDPDDIPRLMAKAHEGFDIVFLRRLTRKDSVFKILTSRLFVLLYNYLSDSRIDPTVSSFAIMSRRAADATCELRESNRSFTMILNWIGFNVGYVDGTHAARFAGKSSYNFRRLLSLAMDAITSHSNRPLYLSIKLGFMFSGGALFAAAWLVGRYFVSGVAVAGWTSVMVSMFFLSGLMFANLGVLGIYLGKAFNEIKKRPLYVIAEFAAATQPQVRVPPAQAPAENEIEAGEIGLLAGRNAK